MATDRPGIQLLLLFNRVNWFATTSPDNRYKIPIGATAAAELGRPGGGAISYAHDFPANKFA